MLRPAGSRVAIRFATALLLRSRAVLVPCPAQVTLFGTQWTRRRFLGRCVPQSAHSEMETLLQGFPNSLAEWRWLSIVHAAEQILPLLDDIAQYWDRGKFRNCTAEDADVRAGDPVAEARQETLKCADHVSEGLASPAFKAFLRVLCVVSSVVTRLESWAKSCPCHSSAALVHNTPRSGHERPKTSRYAFLKALAGDFAENVSPGSTPSPCPLVGCRAPELARLGVMGHAFCCLFACSLRVYRLCVFLHLFHSSCLGFFEELAAGELNNIAREVFSVGRNDVMLIVEGLSEAEQAELLADWTIAEDHVSAYLLLKLSSWEELPLKLCVLGHHNRDQALKGAEACRSLYEADKNKVQQHRCVTEIMEGAMREQLDRWIERQCGPEDFPDLYARCVLFKLVCSMEMSIESAHACMKKRLSSTRMSPAYFSAALRMPEIMQLCRARPMTFLEELAPLVPPGKRHAAVRLGLGQHYLLAPKVTSKNLCRVIYHTAVHDVESLRAHEANAKRDEKAREKQSKAMREAFCPQRLDKKATAAQPEQRLNALVWELGVGHFQQQCDPNKFYTVVACAGASSALRSARP